MIFHRMKYLAKYAPVFTRSVYYTVSKRPNLAENYIKELEAVFPHTLNMDTRLIECVPNFSEGQNQKV